MEFIFIKKRIVFFVFKRFNNFTSGNGSNVLGKLILEIVVGFISCIFCISKILVELYCFNLFFFENEFFFILYFILKNFIMFSIVVIEKKCVLFRNKCENILLEILRFYNVRFLSF